MGVCASTRPAQGALGAKLGSAAKWLGLLVATLAGVAFIGWALHFRLLTTFIAGGPGMVPLTALVTLVCGLSLAMVPAAHPRLRRLARPTALVILVVALLRLASYKAFPNWNPDGLGFANFQGGVRMAPFTAFSLALFALALYLLPSPKAALLVNGLSLLVILICCLVFSWFAFGGQPLLPQAIVAFPTALSLTLLAIGTFCLLPERGVTALLTERSAGGTLARRLLLPAVLIPFSVGWLRLKAQHAGWIEMEAGLALVILANAILFTALVIATARALSLSERRKELAIENNRHLAAIVQSSDDAIVSKSLEGIITSWNPAAERLFGYSPEEAIGKPILILFPPELVPEEQLLLSRILKGETIEHYETVRVKKNGERFDISLTISPIRDESGQILGVSKIGHDITGRKAAQRSLTLFRTLLDNSTDGIEVIDPETSRFLDINETTCLRLGYTRQELLSMTVPEVETASITPEMWRETILALKPKGSRTIEGRHRRKDGSTFPVEVNVRYIQAQQDYLIAIVRDITDRKEAEASLRHTQQQLQSLIEQAPICIAMFDRDLHYLIASKQWISAFGRGRQELVGVSHYELHPDLPERWKEAHQRGLAGERVSDEGSEWTDADGHKHWLRWALHPWREPRGEIGGVIIWAEDTTDEIQALENLRRSEEKFRQLAENIQEVFWITDAGKNRMVYVSPAYEKIWGRDCQSLYNLPHTWSDALHPEDRDRVLSAVRDQQDQGTYDLEYRILRPDKTTRWIHDRAFPIRDERGVVTRIVGTAEDITQRKKLEEQFRQAQKMEGIGQLAGGVAHDFNNILAAIQMQAELLKLGDVMPPEAAAEEIVATVQRAAALTRQLLLFSRQQIFQPRDIELNKSIADTLSMLKRMLGETTQMHIRLSPEPLFTHADAGMLDQVLMNLVVNARDAMPDGGQIIIESSATEIDELAAQQSSRNRPGSYIVLSVSDTGTGIPPDVLPKIFEPFFTTKAVGKGTGLGLATVFGIAQQHQGWINVYSEVGRGATFRLYLPRLRQVDSTASRSQATNPVPRGTETILLVEDDSALRTSLGNALRQLGYHVLEAPTARKALEVWGLNKAAVRLVLTDLVMPDGMTGRDLGKRLLAESPEMKIIYMSGYSAELIGKDSVLEEGVNFLTKPFPVSKLAQAVRQNLDRAQE